MRSFLKRISRAFRADPTRDWPDVVHRELRIDVVRQTVAGLRLRCPEDELRTIGRPGNAHADLDERYNYPSLGLKFDVDDRRVTGASVCLQHLRPSDGPRAERCVVIGQFGEGVLDGRSHVDELSRLIGPPIESEDTIDDVVHTYRLGVFNLVAECSPQGQLQFIAYFQRLD